MAGVCGDVGGVAGVCGGVGGVAGVCGGAGKWQGCVVAFGEWQGCVHVVGPRPRPRVTGAGCIGEVAGCWYQCWWSGRGQVVISIPAIVGGAWCYT